MSTKKKIEQLERQIRCAATGGHTFGLEEMWWDKFNSYGLRGMPRLRVRFECPICNLTYSRDMHNLTPEEIEIVNRNIPAPPKKDKK